MNKSRKKAGGRQSPAAERADSTGVQPIQRPTSLPSPGGSGAKEGVGRRDTVTAHPGWISTSWEIDRLSFQRGLPAPHYATFLTPAVKKQTSPQQDAYPRTSADELVRAQASEFMCPPELPHALCVDVPNEITHASRIVPHEFMKPPPCARHELLDTNEGCRENDRACGTNADSN